MPIQVDFYRVECTRLGIVLQLRGLRPPSKIQMAPGWVRQADASSCGIWVCYALLAVVQGWRPPAEPLDVTQRAGRRLLACLFLAFIRNKPDFDIDVFIDVAELNTS
jgi:hypothetical protein